MKQRKKRAIKIRKRVRIVLERDDKVTSKTEAYVPLFLFERLTMVEG